MLQMALGYGARTPQRSTDGTNKHRAVVGRTSEPDRSVERFAE